MEELFAALLEVIVEGDLIAEAALFISEDILSEVAFSMEMLGEVYSTMVESLSVFKEWMVTTFELTEDVVNAMLGLQIMYNMIYTHYQQVAKSGRCISVSVALEDIEATLKKTSIQMIELARKQIAQPNFSKLPADIQKRIRDIEHQAPMQYWLSVKIDIMHSLMKLPIYSHS